MAKAESKRTAHACSPICRATTVQSTHQNRLGAHLKPRTTGSGSILVLCARSALLFVLPNCVCGEEGHCSEPFATCPLLPCHSRRIHAGRVVAFLSGANRRGALLPASGCVHVLGLERRQHLRFFAWSVTNDDRLQSNAAPLTTPASCTIKYSESTITHLTLWTKASSK